MKTNNTNVQILTVILLQIHAYNYSPFYEKDEDNLWDKIPEKSSTTNEIDKVFFRNMADWVINFLKKSNDKTTDFAVILSRIHSHKLLGFYIDKIDSNNMETGWDGYEWDKLPTLAGNDNQVDKTFFLEMAEDILNLIEI